ncbi:unnamed protein product [Caenorhabditis angaria]|uniref:Serpentine Receptor, class I n=1 Tax=Caenorhabditis angaria TaxID=860376 RepID=A0A9P1IZB4_9PELO|nr:unnamed protein product [Caenorhabditis angaria]
MEISFEPPQILLYFYYFIGTISLFLNAFGIYLTIFKGIQMDTFKYYLLVFQILCMIIDFHITFLMQPVGLFPLVAGTSNGILSSFFDITTHWQMSITNLLITAQTGSMAVCFIRKHQAIAQIDRKNIISRHLFFVICLSKVFWSFATFFIFLQAGMTKTEQFEYIFSNSEAMIYYENFENLKNFAIYKVETITEIALGMIIINGLISVITTIWATNQMFIMLRKNRTRISQASYLKHKSALLSLFAQFITSSVCIIPPVIITITVVTKMKYSQELSHYLLAIFSSHSTINILVMIVTFPAYRKFCMFWRKSTNIVNVSSVIVTKEIRSSYK